MISRSPYVLALNRLQDTTFPLRNRSDIGTSRTSSDQAAADFRSVEEVKILMRAGSRILRSVQRATIEVVWKPGEVKRRAFARLSVTFSSTATTRTHSSPHLASAGL